MLLGVLYSISIQGQNYKFETKVSDNREIESIKTSDFLPLAFNGSIKIELTPVSIKFIIHTDDSYFVKLAKSLNLNKEFDLPIQIQFENGKVINSKSPGMNYVKFLKCEGDELSEALGLSSSCEFEINIVSLYTDVSGKDVQSKNETFLALFNNNDIKYITICNNYLLSIVFNKVKTSEIIKLMSKRFDPLGISTSDNRNMDIDKIVSLAKLVIDKPWGCLDYGTSYKSVAHFQRDLKLMGKFTNGSWFYTKQPEKYSKCAYVIGDGKELNFKDTWILPHVYFNKSKIIGYMYSIYIDKKINAETAKLIMTKLANKIGIFDMGVYIPIESLSMNKVGYHGIYNNKIVCLSYGSNNIIQIDVIIDRTIKYLY